MTNFAALIILRSVKEIERSLQFFGIALYDVIKSVGQMRFLQKASLFGAQITPRRNEGGQK